MDQNRLDFSSSVKVPGKSRRRQTWRISAVAAVVFLLTPFTAEGRSTFTAQFEANAVAGPAIEQTISLYFTYFPGDGEAIVRSRVSFGGQVIGVSAVSAVMGRANLSESGEISVEYAEAPLGWGATDTLRIAMAASSMPADVPVVTAIYTTADVEARAHEVSLELGVVPALDLELALEPGELLPNESATLKVKIGNLDREEVLGISWIWPETLSLVEAEEWGQPLEPDQERSLSYDVRVSPQAQDSIIVVGRADASGLLGSPLPELVIYIAPAPEIRIDMPEEFLLLGDPVAIEFVLSNPTAHTIHVSAVEIDVPAGFEVSPAASESVPFSVSTEQDGAKSWITVNEPFSLAPEGSHTLSVDAVPNRVGPFAWESRFRAEGHREFVKLRGNPIVSVRRPLDAEDFSADSAADLVLTDLEAVSSALQERLDRGLDNLALASATRIVLRSDEKETEQTWIIDELLTAALLDKGYRVVIAPAEEDSGNVAVLSYRLVDSRAVYSPPGVSWRSLLLQTGSQLREATGDLFVRLTESQSEGGKLLWAERINAYRADDVAGEGSQWLGDSEVVERSTVSPDNKILEVGLSGLIATGLVLVFFAP